MLYALNQCTLTLQFAFQGEQINNSGCQPEKQFTFILFLSRDTKMILTWNVVESQIGLAALYRIDQLPL